jgi:L-cysteine/cystine lyase
MSAISFLEQQREQFPALANKAYFNYGGQGPLPQPALAAIYNAYEQVQRTGPFSQATNSWVGQQIRKTRDAIAKELGANTETIALTEDVTVGCNIALWGLDWRAGDRLLITDCEHPGVIAVIQEIQRRHGIQIDTCPIKETLNEGDAAALIHAHLKPQTRLVVLSHLLWNTGQILPLKEIVRACRENSSDTQVLVDGAQSVGSMPLNLPETGVDFYAFTGHKWWCGPAGVGGLYVSAAALQQLSPTFIGWRGITLDATGQPTGWKSGGQRYEIATSAYPLYAGLQEAIAFHHQWGTPQQRFQRIQQLSSYLWKRLSQLPQVTCLRTSPPEAGLISFQLTNGRSHQECVEYLEKHRIFVRTLRDPDCIRACVHYLTLESECDRLVEAIERF